MAGEEAGKRLDVEWLLRRLVGNAESFPLLGRKSVKLVTPTLSKTPLGKRTDFWDTNLWLYLIFSP